MQRSTEHAQSSTCCTTIRALPSHHAACRPMPIINTLYMPMINTVTRSRSTIMRSTVITIRRLSDIAVSVHKYRSCHPYWRSHALSRALTLRRAARCTRVKHTSQACSQGTQLRDARTCAPSQIADADSGWWHVRAAVPSAPLSPRQTATARTQTLGPSPSPTGATSTAPRGCRR